MARLKEITIIGLDAWCKVYLYTVLEERENPERRLIRSIYGKTTHSINLTENEDTFIEKMEQTGICLLDNRDYDFITEDCGSWYVHICYDDKEIAICGWDYIPEEVRKVLRMMDIDLWRKGKMKEALREESFGAFVIGGDAMPMKPKRPCSYPGCPNLTDGRFCPEHQKQVNSNYEKYGRDKSTKKDTVVHGRGSVTSMLRSIPFVNCVSIVESSCRQKRSIIRSR